MTVMSKPRNLFILRFEKTRKEYLTEKKHIYPSKKWIHHNARTYIPELLLAGRVCDVQIHVRAVVKLE